MWLLGQLESGFYDNDHADVSPELLQAYYGVDGDPMEPPAGTSGAGATADDQHFPPIHPEVSSHHQVNDDDTDADLPPEEAAILAFVRSQLQTEQERHVRHPPIKVPPNACPFEQGDLEVFQTSMAEALEDHFVPAGYGVLDDEWEGNAYSELEPLVGQKQRSTIEIQLTHEVWYPRAVKWAVGLHIMDSVLAL